MRDTSERAIRQMQAIGIVTCPARYRFEAPRQAVLARDNRATITLYTDSGMQDALTGLAGFERIWVLYEFHLNEGWQPFVQPPHQDMPRVGMLATRSPHRPNRIGMSCVKLIAIGGLTLTVANHDLLDRTPVLDIKPYLPYADSFPDVRAGWVAKHAGFDLRSFVHVQLSEYPTDTKRKRVSARGEDRWEIAFRTWRIQFRVTDLQIVVDSISSGYTPEQLADRDDRYGDKHIHREFLAFTAS